MLPGLLLNISTTTATAANHILIKRRMVMSSWFFSLIMFCMPSQTSKYGELQASYVWINNDNAVCIHTTNALQHTRSQQRRHASVIFLKTKKNSSFCYDNVYSNKKTPKETYLWLCVSYTHLNVCTHWRRERIHHNHNDYHHQDNK